MTNPKSYISLSDSCRETVVCGSRFIGYVYHIESEDDALAKLSALKVRHYDATHICYAYIADADGQRQRFSDAGEPSGTAGLPLLEALKKRGARCVLIAVVRYFGGTKLGAGRLGRTYADSAASAMDISAEMQFRFCDIYKVSLSFSDYKKAAPQIERLYKILATEYTNGASIQAAVPDNNPLAFERLIKDLTGGRAELVKIDSRYVLY